MIIGIEVKFLGPISEMNSDDLKVIIIQLQKINGFLNIYFFSLTTTTLLTETYVAYIF